MWTHTRFNDSKWLSFAHVPISRSFTQAFRHFKADEKQNCSTKSSILYFLFRSLLTVENCEIDNRRSTHIWSEYCNWLDVECSRNDDDARFNSHGFDGSHVRVLPFQWVLTHSELREIERNELSIATRRRPETEEEIEPNSRSKTEMAWAANEKHSNTYFAFCLLRLFIHELLEDS